MFGKVEGEQSKGETKDKVKKKKKREKRGEGQGGAADEAGVVMRGDETSHFLRRFHRELLTARIVGSASAKSPAASSPVSP